MTDLKQKLLIEYLINSVDTYARCRAIVQPEYFNPEFRSTVQFIHTYYDKYNTTPNTDQVLSESGVQFDAKTIEAHQLRWCADEIEKFCKRKAIERAIIQSPQLIAKEDYSKVEQLIRDALLVSLNTDIGEHYFNDYQQRLERGKLTAHRYTTGWPQLDDEIAGGIARSEFLLFSANSGGGKSITLANFALNQTMNYRYPNHPEKMCVIYFTFELAKDLVCQRFDQMLTGVPSVIWKDRLDYIGDQLAVVGSDRGDLYVKYMDAGTTPRQIRAYLKEFELVTGKRPDVMIFDYLDILDPDSPTNGDVFEKDKAVTTELRNILMEYNAIGATASQQNRSAVGAKELNHSHIAGGISKINTVDWYASILFDPSMKNAGQIGFHLLKTRNSDGVGKTIILEWKGSHLRIIDQNNTTPNHILVDNTQQPRDNRTNFLSFIEGLQT